MYNIFGLYIYKPHLREPLKNVVFFRGPATKRGGGLKAGPLRKITFFEARKKNPKKMWPKCSKLEGGGGEAPNKRTFFAASQNPIVWVRTISLKGHGCF